MAKEFVTYEIALKLKELGFNEECFGFYKTSLNESTPELIIIKCNYNSGKYITIPEEFHEDAPLWQQAIDWVREKHGIHIILTINPYSEYTKDIYGWKIYRDSVLQCIINSEDETYEFKDSLEISMLKAIELVQNKPL